MFSTVSGDYAGDKSSMALSGNAQTLIFGPFDRLTTGGRIRVYYWSTSPYVQWEYCSQLESSFIAQNVGDGFGYSVAVNTNGNIFVAGTAQHDTNTPAIVGYVEVHSVDNSACTSLQLGTTLYCDSTSNTQVALNGDGTRLAMACLELNYVRVFDYDYSSDTWVKIGNDLSSTNVNDIEFGVQLSFDDVGDTLAVLTSDDNGTGVGYVNIYQYSTSDWSILQTISMSDLGQRNAMDLSGDGRTLAIGSANLNEVQMFDTSTWNTIGSVIVATEVNDASTMLWGTAVALNYDGTYLFASAPAWGNFGTIGYGTCRLYWYDGVSNDWILAQNGAYDLGGSAPNGYPGTIVDINDDGNVVVFSTPVDEYGINRGFAETEFLGFVPSTMPSDMPSETPSISPSAKPSIFPTNKPSAKPSDAPTQIPSVFPSLSPTMVPSYVPSMVPSEVPSDVPTNIPTIVPTKKPSNLPSLSPTMIPSYVPSILPTEVPSVAPTLHPSKLPSALPSTALSTTPSIIPSIEPSVLPIPNRSFNPSLVATLTPSTAPSTSAQYNSLLDLYLNTSGDSWQGTNWFADDVSNECTFTGVTCDNDGIVIGIELPHVQMDGTLPYSFTSLSYLEVLNLQYNNLLTGPVPLDILSTLPVLRSLDLSYTSLSGTIGDTWSASLSSTLFYLDVRGTLLTGTVPNIWCDIKSSIKVFVQCDKVYCDCCDCTSVPSYVPSTMFSFTPSKVHSEVPSSSYRPSQAPSEVPTYIPSQAPSEVPTYIPSQAPSEVPTYIPSQAPSEVPSHIPSVVPSVQSYEYGTIPIYANPVPERFLTTTEDAQLTSLTFDFITILNTDEVHVINVTTSYPALVLLPESSSRSLQGQQQQQEQQKDQNLPGTLYVTLFVTAQCTSYSAIAYCDFKSSLKSYMTSHVAEYLDILKADEILGSIPGTYFHDTMAISIVQNEEEVPQGILTVTSIQFALQYGTLNVAFLNTANEDEGIFLLDTLANETCLFLNVYFNSNEVQQLQCMISSTLTEEQVLWYEVTANVPLEYDLLGTIEYIFLNFMSVYEETLSNQPLLNTILYSDVTLLNTISMYVPTYSYGTSSSYPTTITYSVSKDEDKVNSGTLAAVAAAAVSR